MRFNGRSGSPADPGAIVGVLRCARSERSERLAHSIARLVCHERALRDPGPRRSRRSSPGALRPGSERADARGSRHEPLAVVSSHDVKQRSVVRSRGALLRPGSRFSFRVHPARMRGGRSADRRTISVCRVCETRRSARVRRGASHDAGRSPLGAPPWRFSAGGRASISGIASGSVQRAPRSQVVMPGGRCPGPPEPAVTSRGRRTPLPAPPFRTVSGRRPSMSEDGNLCTINSLRSQ